MAVKNGDLPCSKVSIQKNYLKALNKEKAYETDKGRLNQKPQTSKRRRSFHPDHQPPVLHWLFRPSKAVIDAHAELEVGRWGDALDGLPWGLMHEKKRVEKNDPFFCQAYTPEN